MPNAEYLLKNMAEEDKLFECDESDSFVAPQSPAIILSSKDRRKRRADEMNNSCSNG